LKKAGRFPAFFVFSGFNREKYADYLRCIMRANKRVVRKNKISWSKAKFSLDKTAEEAYSIVV
jgi:hypothetical protein